MYCQNLLLELVVIVLQIVSLIDINCSSQETISLVMEFVETDLKQFIDDVHRPLNDRVIRFYFAQLLQGVAYLHHSDIMHRVRAVRLALQEG
jgi:cyclin-dependent kinase 18